MVNFARLATIYPELRLFDNEQVGRDAVKEASRTVAKTPLFWAGLVLWIAIVVIGPILLFPHFLPSSLPSAVSGGVYGGVIGGLFGGAFQFLLRRPIQRKLRQRLIELCIPVCLQCGYDLRGQLEPRCPECGCGFDPKLLEHSDAVV